MDDLGLNLDLMRLVVDGCRAGVYCVAGIFDCPCPKCAIPLSDILWPRPPLEDRTLGKL